LTEVDLLKVDLPQDHQAVEQGLLAVLLMVRLLLTSF
jgi:hypothetical protein